jgi:hypothetical protein
MKFFQCLKRELFWWWSSPSLWLSFPLLLIALSVFLPLAWWATGIKVAEVEGLWRAAVMMWNFGGKRSLESNGMLMMAIGQYMPLIESTLALRVEDIWERFVLPCLQVLSTLSLTLVISPVAVAVFKRDLDSGAFKQALLSGTPAFSFLFVKMLSLLLILLPAQMIAMTLTLTLYQNGSGHPEFFSHVDLSWWFSFIAIGLGLGLWTVAVSWILCLIYKNDATEIYASSAVGIIATSAMALSAQHFGWHVSSMLVIAMVCWLSLPLALMAIGFVVRRSSYLYR